MMNRASTFLPSKKPTIGIIAMVKNAEGERINPAWNASYPNNSWSICGVSTLDP